MNVEKNISINTLPQRWFNNFPHDFSLILFWMVTGATIRFTNLTSKPPWTDEFATLVFSLGNNYASIPLNQVISLDMLLQPLKPNPDASITDVFSLLVNEDNHPPLYFMLAHWWLQLFPSTEYVSLWAARSLPVCFAVISIPAIYLLGRLAFNRQVARCAAAMIAVSPYGVFLAQEARHYSLAILLVIASLICLIVAIKYLCHATILPHWLILVWTGINLLGLGVHYFFCLTLLAQAMALLFKFRSGIKFNNWLRLGMVAAGTIIPGFLWIFLILPQDYGNEMTDWIRHDQNTILTFISPIFQALATWITMLSLLPVESSSFWVMVISVLVMIMFFVWALPLLFWGISIPPLAKKFKLSRDILGGFVVSAIALFFILTYFFGIDLTRGARYSFVYFPGVIILLGASLATLWKHKKKNTVIIIFLMALFSSITVCYNLGYQKYYRPDIFISIINNHSSVPVLIATTHKTLVQTGEMMGIARELKQQHSLTQTAFLLVKQSPIATKILHQAITEMSRPFDLWMVNFYAPVAINNCVADASNLPPVNGYNYQLYHCN